MATTKYTVKKGDTLSEIALKYGTTVSKLVELNDISDPDYIVVGQVLIIRGAATNTSTNYSSRAVIKNFGLQSNTDRTVYATWTWDKSNTDHYEVKWLYATGDGVGFIGSKSDEEDKQSLYTAPENATHVSFYVKPVSKTRGENSDSHYWTAEWSTVQKYYFKNNPPSTPSAPSVEIEDFKLTAELDNIDLNADSIQFQIVKNDKTVFKTGTAKITKAHASYSCTVSAGSEYKVRCRAVRDGLYSDWSEYSDNRGTIPSAPDSIITLKALTETSVYIDWANVSNSTSYDVEYTTQKRYFDSSSEVQKLTVESVVGHAEITGLDTGEEWFFRVRAVNDQGASSWSEIKSIKIGKAPAAPTTWSSSSTVITGEDLKLYWVHNSEDGSSQTYAEVEVIIGGVTNTYAIRNSTNEDEKDKTSVYVIKTSGYTEGTKILWRVRTRGILSTYGDWSIQRVVDVYAPPTVEISVTDADGNMLDELRTFPFYISATTRPSSQRPIGYNVNITANEPYETTDNVGNPKMVNQGEEVYTRFFDISDQLLIELSANSVNLTNNISYTITCSATMDSGLTAESSTEFTVYWDIGECWPNAEISYDSETFTTSIRPYCINEYEVLTPNVSLAVYRREFNGSFTELATGIDNSRYTFITDPHPSLDYARYRIVATDLTNSKVSYFDMPGYPVGEKAVIIQWDEEWTSFDTNSDDALERPAWSGSLLRLPYNIDVADKHDPDVELVEYIGREHPVSYYGTQLGETSTWSVAIEKSDRETLYALRRLSAWMGDVYVREPSGSGYWANVTVSFSQKHLDLTIPVTLDIVRVAGGA